jgi:hypothetical protein
MKMKMKTTYPVSSKLLEFIEYQRVAILNKNKLDNIKPLIDIKPPKKYIINK